MTTDSIFLFLVDFYNSRIPKSRNREAGCRHALPYQDAEYPELREMLALCNYNVRNMCISADAIQVNTLNAFLKGSQRYFLIWDLPKFLLAPIMTIFVEVDS